MKAKAEKTHASKPAIQRRGTASQGKADGPFIPPSLQTKLTINEPGDPYEREADAMAERVTSGESSTVSREASQLRRQPEEEEESLQLQPEEEEETLQMQPEDEEEALQLQPEEEEESLQRQCTDCEEEESLQMQPEEQEEALQLQREEEEESLQRQCADCEEEESLQLQPEEEEESLQMQPEEEEEALQLQPEEEEEKLQRSAGEGGTTGRPVAPPIVNRVLTGQGEPIDKGTRTSMERGFGADFSGVRIHKDSQAQQSAKAISAQAYTYGPHIVFGRGHYEPHTSRGRHLLAHELTHVVQQGATVRRQMEAIAATSSQNPSATPAPPSPEQATPAITPEPVAQTANPARAPATAAEEVPAEAGGTAAPATEPIEPLMPPPPEELGEAAQQRLRQSQRNARQAGENNADLPTAEASTQEAREGVTEPTEETDARASGDLAAALSERPAPSPEIEELCANIRRVIRDKRPPDEDSLLQADPEEAANEAGTQLNDNIESDVDRVEGQYDELDENPTGEAEQIGQPVETPPESVDSPNLRAGGAAPDPLTEEEVSLEADVEASNARLEEAGMQTAVADQIQDGPVAEARATQGELEETAEEDPALVLAEQDAALTTARADMETLQAQAMAALEASRSRTVGGSTTQQTAMVGSEEQQRQALGTQAENIFAAAQEQVNTLLEPLTRTAMGMWDTGKARIATEFEQHLARVQRWVDDRHSGFGGGVVELWDDLTGLPDWVTDEYNDAERRFGDSICDLIREISTYVNGVILTCEELIDNANREIDNLFANAPEELAEWAAEQRELFQGRLDGLREQVHNTQQSFNEDLANRAAEAVQEVRERVHALREAAKGLLGRIADFISDFLEDPVRAIINGLLSLVGIEPSAFWNLLSRIEQVMADIADDPLGFASNLLAAIGAGFEQFFDNFVSHLFEGFIEWLFSGLGAMGIEIPSDFSLSSIITFFLQLMGITWDRIRELLAKHIGEENVALLEQAFEIISDLIELGPEGVFQLIEDQLDPAHILDTIIDMAVDYVVEALVEQATIRIIGLFNPVGAIVQAIEAIYRVFKWIFENAARIFTLVESVVNGMADIIAGNIAGMAATVENALARLLVPVIDFVAEFLHLGELPEKVADAVRGLQNWVEGILDRVIGWLANQARGILSALGLTEDGEQEEGGEDGTLEDTEVGESVAFSGGGEQHRIWIRESGDQLELMVASDDPMPLRERLAGWRQTATSLPQETKTEAERLIGVVQSQYNIVLEEGEDSQEAKETAQADPTPENIAAAQNEDGQVVREQREMTPELGQLFDLFEGGVAFSPTEESVSIGVGQLRVGIAESAEGRLEAQLEGQDVDRQMAVMEQGPIGTAQHVFGITLVREVSLQVSEVNEALNQVAVTNGKIPSASHRNLADWMGRLRNQIGRLSPTKARSFKHLTSGPPSPIDNFLVEFGQQLGTSQTITDEYDRQLGLQQAGLNQISIDQWIINRNAYKLQDSTFVNLDAEERRAVLMELQRRAADSRDRARGRRQRFIDAIAAIEEALEPVNLADPQYTPDFSNISLVTNRFGNERNWRGKRRQEVKDIMKELRTGANDWQTIFRRSAVLHNADQIAGGFGFIPDIARVPRPADNADQAEWDAYLEELSQFVGSANVNSSIGSLWQHKINGLEQHVRDNYPGPGWAIWKMNVTLRRV